MGALRLGYEGALTLRKVNKCAIIYQKEMPQAYKCRVTFRITQLDFKSNVKVGK